MLVIQLQQHGDVQLLGTVAGAVAAGGAGQPPAQQSVGDGEQGAALLFAEGTLRLKGGDVVLELLEVGHPGQGDGHAGDVLQEAEGPCGGGFAGAEGAQPCLVFRGQRSQLSAPHRLHHPHGDVPLLEQLNLGPGVLEGPVHVIELNLAELHVLPVGVQEPLHDRKGAVDGKAQMADSAVLFLFHQVGEDAVLLVVQVGVDVHLAEVVKQVKIKVIHAALLELPFKNLLYLGHIGQIVSGELIREIEAVPGVLGQGLSQRGFRIAGMITPGGVVVIDAVGHGIVHQLLGGGGVNSGVVALQHGQAHSAHAQGGQL